MAHFLQQFRARNFFAAHPQFGTVSAIPALFVRMEKLFHFSCMKSDLDYRPLETIGLYGQWCLVAPHFTLGVPRVKFRATRPPQTTNTQFKLMNN